MAKTLAKVFGVIFLLVGILGFFGNGIVGMSGFFHANMAHNIVHLALGLILVLCQTEAKARLWLTIVGVIYLLVGILGFAMGATGQITSLLGFIEVNSADNWLHIVLGVVILLSALGAKKRSMQPASPQM